MAEYIVSPNGAILKDGVPMSPSEIISELKGNKRIMTKEDYNLGAWMSAAMEDQNVCIEMKHNITAWFNTFTK